MTVLDQVLDRLEELSNEHKKILAMLSKESQETIIKELNDNPTLGDGIPVDARYPATDEPEEGKIVWITHNNVKYKACKYKCGNYVSWDNNTKKYIHYDAEFKLIGADCPKFGGN